MIKPEIVPTKTPNLLVNLKKAPRKKAPINGAERAPCKLLANVRRLPLIKANKYEIKVDKKPQMKTKSLLILTLFESSSFYMK